MTWVRFDDQYPIHRKVAALSDAAYRLHSASIPWSNRNLMDGWIPAEDLDQVCAQVRKSSTFVLELVRRGLFHEAGFVCDSETCPADGSQMDGWVIHDYWDYQPSREKVKGERAKNAERQQRFRDRRSSKSGKDQSNGVTNGVTNGGVTAPRPDPARTSPNGEVDEALFPPPEKPKKASRKKPETPITDPFVVSDDMRSWAAENAPGINVDKATAKFVNHAHANDRRQRDWVAAWRNWLLNERPDQYRSNGNVVAIRGGNNFDEKHAMLARQKARAAEMDALEGRA